MSLDAMEEEILNQPDDLPRFADKLRMESLTLPDTARTIFTGSGDSYAAALFARGLSGGLAAAEDPYELFRNPRTTRGKTVVVISVSGRTRANIRLVKRLRGIAERRIIVTANPNSSLGQMGDERMVLQYRRARVVTSGTTSFTTSLLVCASLLGKLPREINLQGCVKKALVWAKSWRPSAGGEFLFIGSGADRGLAEYGACKIHEVLGAKADAQYPEQVGHAQLFAIGKKRDTIVCIFSSKEDKMTEIFGRFSRNGFRTLGMVSRQKHPVTRGLESAVFLQCLALRIARKRGMRECAFLTDKTRLRLSNRMIY